MSEDEQPAKRRKTVITPGTSFEGRFHLTPQQDKDQALGRGQPLANEPERHGKKSSAVRRQEAEGDALFRARKELPIWKHRTDIKVALRGQRNNILVLVGETGSGKSTQVPQFLYRESWCRRQTLRRPGSQDEMSVGGVIAITQPRRVAATTLAYRVAQETGTPLGKGYPNGRVGYSVRFDHQVPHGTKIKFLTEGTLLQELLRDPHLCQYSAVVVDEIHERSLDVDLLVGFLKLIVTGDLQGRAGVPLKVIIMSATADVDAIERFFNDTPSEGVGGSTVQVLRIQGRQFPVDIIYEPKPVPIIEDAVLERIKKIHVEEALPGDILAFLTGQDEIESQQRLIEEYAATLDPKLPKIKVFPLFGQLSTERQREAFLPVKTSFTRKVVLATNIAETSVTVPGVRYVVDCGKSKVKKYRPQLGMESLLSKAISKSSALQRAGRAGREGPGKCYRLYMKGSFETLKEADLPEILRTDVVGAVLAMKARGIQNVLAFSLMDKPPMEAIEPTFGHLHFLGALTDKGAITPEGMQMARLPIPASLGAVLLNAAKPEFDCVLEVIDIISCVTSGDDIFLNLRSEDTQEQAAEPHKELSRREGDIITYLTTMQRYTAENADRTQWCKKRAIKLRNMRQSLDIRKQLRRICLKEKLISETPPPDPVPFTPISLERAEAILKCFLRGFVAMSALLGPDGSYVTFKTKQIVAIHPSSVLHGQKVEAIMFLENVFTQKNYVKKVSAIRADWVREALETKYSYT